MFASGDFYEILSRRCIESVVDKELAGAAGIAIASIVHVGNVEMAVMRIKEGSLGACCNTSWCWRRRLILL